MSHTSPLSYCPATAETAATIWQILASAPVHEPMRFFALTGYAHVCVPGVAENALGLERLGRSTLGDDCGRVGRIRRWRRRRRVGGGRPLCNLWSVIRDDVLRRDRARLRANGRELHRRTTRDHAHQQGIQREA